MHVIRRRPRGPHLAAALAAAALTAPGAAPAAPAPGPALTAGIERAIIRATNAERAARGRPPLRGASALTRAARSHSAELAASGAFRHEGPDGAPFRARLTAEGVPAGRRVAENIAWTTGCAPGTAGEVVRMWMNSPAHRRNLLDPALRTTGVGVAIAGACDRVLVTADYGA